MLRLRLPRGKYADSLDTCPRILPVLVWKCWDYNWGFAQHGLACELALRYSPDPGTRFAHCSMYGRMLGDGFDGRVDVWKKAPS